MADTTTNTMATTTSGTTATDINKKKVVNYPYAQPGQMLPLSQAAVQDQSALSGASQVFNAGQSAQTLAAAQQKAQQGTTMQTANLVSQQAQNLLQNPSQDTDYEAQKKLALDTLQRTQAQDLEAMRQATGGVANTGVNIADLLSTQLSQRQEKTDLSRQMDIDAQAQKQQDLLNALAAGQEAVSMEQGLQTSDINNMINAAGGALGFAELASKQDILLSEQDFTAEQNALAQEYALAIQSNDIEAQKDILTKQLAFEAQQAALGYEFTAQQNELNRLLQTNLANLDANTQKELVNLKALVDKDMLMTQQDFAATQAELQRQFEEAMQSNDFAQANSMAIMLQEFETLKQTAQNEWQSAENLAQNAFTQQMQMTQNEFDKAMQYLEYEQQSALDTQDFEQQKLLMDKQNELEMQMLLQNFNHDEKMAILDSELQDALANNDVERQKQLYTYSHNLEMEKITQEQGFEQGMAYINNQLAQALQDNDYANATALQELKFSQEMQIHLDEMEIENAKIELQQQGIDMAQLESAYAKMQAQIDSGLLAPENATAFLEQEFASILPDDFTFTEADPQATQKALYQDYLNQQYQYALAQGLDPDTGLPSGAVFDDNGNFTGLTDDTITGFNDYLQESIYGQTGTPLQAAIIGLKNGDIPFDQITADQIDYLAKDITTAKVADNYFTGISEYETGSGSDSRRIYPELEGKSFVLIGGTLYHIDSYTIDDQWGDDDTVYHLTSTDGTTKDIRAAKN